MDDVPTQRVAADGSEAATVCLPLPPLEFNRYELLRELGRGGTGVVWMAHDRILGAQVALKTLRPEITSEPSALRELKSEVLINRTLSHPHIVRTYDFVSSDRSSAISMEFVSGTNLHRLKSERPNGFFDCEEIERWMLQLCDAMEYAHQRGVVHRDLKPANLMIDEQGNLKVGDFGIGQTATETLHGLTRKSSGTPPFMSPQQTMGERAVPADDIYGIGATIYDLLTGDPPFFRGAIREQTLAKVAPSMSDRRKELNRNGKAIPARWEAAVASALCKEASGRPASAAAFRVLLADRPTASLPVPARRRAPPLGKTAAAVAAVTAALVAAAFAGWRLRSAVSRTLGFAPAAPSASAPASPSAFAPAVPPPRAAAPASGPPAPLAGAAAGAPAPSFSDDGFAGIDRLVRSGSVSADEATWIRRALVGQQGEFEQALATRLVVRHTLTPAQWRAYSALTPPADPTVAKLRPLLMAGQIRENEFPWLAAALENEKGAAEAQLAFHLVDLHDLSPADWRSRTALYPPPPVDPIVAKVKPWLDARRLSAAEADWVEAALRGGKSPAEKSLAEDLIDGGRLTPFQWRAKTALEYPLSAVAGNPGAWPPALDLPLSATVTLRLLRVDPGTFLRGTPADEPGRRNNEPLPSPVRIDQPFYLGVTEVTQAQYTAVMPRNPSYWRGHPDWPIDQVDWQSLTGSDGFLERLNRRLDSMIGGALVADLPTNDEWEFACRAGTQGSFYTGTSITDVQRDANLDRLANYDQTDEGSPQAVGSFQPNAWGFYDMLGNVSEWCRDRFIRGGSWQSNAAGCRIGWQTQSSEDADTDPSPTQGFRLLLRTKSP
ncbi:MAG TPA: bifunctional serine/threonine-protein kinase/formylglycine-generating enzyme family protein [Opitutaceae bacterium]|nr:bifunctional serine/threonine-protein kinase/formylglycine-generating enzyme family protein [Opitutaceae bacterium]